MESLKKNLQDFSIEELDRELVVRGAQIPGEKRFGFKDKDGTPQRDIIMAQVKEVYDQAKSLSPDKSLSHLSTPNLVKVLMQLTGGIAEATRGRWGRDNRRDFCTIEDDPIRKNAECVAAICLGDNLIDLGSGYSILKVKNFGKTFNLCDNEPFRDQPISAGRLCTGFLVKEDMIATAGHFANKKNVTDLRIVFGFKLNDEYTPETKFSNANIYKGAEIVDRVYSGAANEPDWALVRLDHKVEGQSVANLSYDEIFTDQEIYVIGHPCGLPLKYAPGAYVCDINESCFSADLDVYSGNSGSPVFDSRTHEVIGIAVRGDNRDFRWTGKGWISVIYPNLDFASRGAHCTRVSQFLHHCG